MRLPSLTKRQTEIEDARQIHEAMWARYQLRATHPETPDASIHVLIPYEDGIDPSVQQIRLSSNMRGFWNDRGYRFRTKKTEHGIAIWVEATP